MKTHLSFTSYFLVNYISFLKPKSLLLTTLLLVSFTVFSQRTHIPDANFRRVLQSEYNITANSNNTILNSEALSITRLDVPFERIVNLAGIEAFTALTELDCSDNKLTSLDISANTALTELECRGNEFTSLNVKNGNNRLLTDFRAGGNPNLTCIQVDNIVWRQQTMLMAIFP